MTEPVTDVTREKAVAMFKAKESISAVSRSLNLTWWQAKRIHAELYPKKQKGKARPAPKPIEDDPEPADVNDADIPWNITVKVPDAGLALIIATATHDEILKFVELSDLQLKADLVTSILSQRVGKIIDPPADIQHIADRVEALSKPEEEAHAA